MALLGRGESGSDLTSRTTSAFSRRDWEKPRNIPVSTLGAPAAIRTGHLTNITRTTKISVFWVVTPCSCVGGQWRFGGACYLYSSYNSTFFSWKQQWISRKFCSLSLFHSPPRDDKRVLSLMRDFVLFFPLARIELLSLPHRLCSHGHLPYITESISKPILHLLNQQGCVIIN
jgi:hypothetical protein